jgi:DNA-binding MarR family transcriptional regulator
MQSMQLYMALAPFVEEFCSKQKTNVSIATFTKWLAKQEAEVLTNTAVKGLSVESEIASVLGILYRFAKAFSKNMLEQSNINSIDEFTYLMALMVNGPSNKTILIDHMVQEKSTGTEILKRLLTKKYISEKANKEDKRSKLLNITPSGMAALQKALPLMETASRHVTQFLNKQEKETLVVLLKKLELGHRALQHEQA